MFRLVQSFFMPPVREIFPKDLYISLGKISWSFKKNSEHLGYSDQAFCSIFIDQRASGVVALLAGPIKLLAK
jgi:hypothetical protein